jgi:hypothetical protein
MNGAGAGLARGGNNSLAVEIALGRLRRTDADRFVGEAHGEAVLVGVAENRDRAQPKLLGGADDPHRDLATVGYQKLVEHALMSRFRSSHDDAAPWFANFGIKRTLAKY